MVLEANHLQPANDGGGNVEGSSDKHQVKMDRTLGLLVASSFVIGNVIGSGIFISPQGITAAVGSVGASLIVWLVCGIISLLGALCYAELGVLIPESGGDYVYIKHAYGNALAYLYSWYYTMIGIPTSEAIVSLTCANYLLAVFFQDGCGAPPGIIVKLTAVLFIVLIAAINCYSTSMAADVQIFFTAAKILALAVIILGGFVRLGQGYTENLQNGFEGSDITVESVTRAFYSGMWAYSGWNSANYIIEEVKRPERNIPLALILGLGTVTVVYILTNIAYFTVLTPEQLVGSPAVAVTWTQEFLPNLVWLMVLFISMSTFGAAHGALFVSGRLVFAVARDGNFPTGLSFIHVERKTPFVSFPLTAMLSICFIIPNSISTLLNIFGFTSWLWLGVNFLGVIIFRFKKPYKDMTRTFKVPIWIPVLSFLVAVFVIVAPFVDSPGPEFLYAIGFILAGLIFYVPLVHLKLKIPGTDSVTTFIQLLFQVAPTTDYDLFEKDVVEEIIADLAINSVNTDMMQRDESQTSKL